MFVHRNIANVVVHTDLNFLSVLQFAVEVLRVRHIIVCGHYGCGGVRAALDNGKHGLIDNWLRHIQDVGHMHQAQIEAIEGDDRRLDRLCELNVIEQVVNVCRTTVVQDAWEQGQTVAVHGWIYRVEDGLLQNLDVTVTNHEEQVERYHAAIAAPPRH
jgi:carbonic anhydrase